jgi:hypothetical protein
VIGGLLGATCATLIILPAILATLQSRRTPVSASLDPDDPHGRYFEPAQLFGSASNRGDARAEHHARAAE